MPKPSSGPIILCVEDDFTLLNDLCDELRESGYQPVAAADVQQAWQVLEHITPDLILCDVGLPRVSGIEFMQEIRSRDVLSDVPFMLLTAMADRDHILRGRRAGADDYLVKPVDYDMVLASVAARLTQVGRIQRSHAVQLQQHAHELLFQWTNVLDKVSQCALVCGHDLSVRFANRAAYSLCKATSDSPLIVDDEGKIALHPDILGHPQVRAFLRADTEAAKVDIAASGGKRKNWQVSLLALGERKRTAQTPTQTPSSEAEAFVIFLSDLSQRHLHNKAALTRRFALTPTEVQVASLLTDGLTKQEMCERMGVSATTMAFHLRNLFQKTGTKRQAELVALLMSVAWNDIVLPNAEAA